jgi:nucleoside-diphosphate kinase
MKERTLVILKPDVMARGLTGEILSRFERLGLKIIAMKMLRADPKVASEHYKKDDEWLLRKGKQIMQTLNIKSNEDPKKYGQTIVNNLASDLCLYPIIAMILEGHKAVSLVKKHVGPTNPEEAMPGTIRGDYTQDSYLLANQLNRPVITIIHCTDDPKEADKEINMWFKPNEIYDWVRLDESLLYRKGK